IFFTRPLPPPITTIFPYTTLFRSRQGEIWPAKRQIILRLFRNRSSTLIIANEEGREMIPCRSQLAPIWRGPCVQFGFFPSAHHRSEEHTSELQSRGHLVCRLLLEK